MEERKGEKGEKREGERGRVLADSEAERQGGTREREAYLLRERRRR